MDNSIALVTKYNAKVDLAYSVASRSSILDTPENLVMWVGADTVKLPKIDIQGLADQDRNGDMVESDTDVTYGTYQLSEYRNRRLVFDQMDDEEVQGVLAASAGKIFVDTKVTPELDAYRFATYATKAINNSFAATAALGSGTGVEAIDVAMIKLQDASVNILNCEIFVSPTMASYIRQSDQWTRNISVDANDPSRVWRNVGDLDGMPVHVVPKGQFVTGITLYDGTTGGQEAGSYVKNGYDINFLIVDKTAVMQVKKLELLRIFAPTEALSAGTSGVYQKSNKWAYDYIIYHDAFVRDNALDGIYCHYHTS